MKKTVILTAILLAGSATAYAIDAITTRNITKYDHNAANAHIQHVKSQSGEIVLKSNTTTCSVFLNATTTARVAAGTGLPLAQNELTKIKLPSTTHVSFNCTTTAGNRAVYLVK